MPSDDEIDTYCKCGRYTVVDGTVFPDLSSMEIADRLVCKECGRRNPDVRFRYKGAPKGGYPGMLNDEG